MTITHTYNFQSYLVRTTNRRFRDPFIKTTNDIMSTIDRYIEDLCSHNIISMVLTLGSNKRVFTDSIGLNFIDYVGCSINGINYDTQLNSTMESLRPAFCGLKRHDQCIRALDALLEDTKGTSGVRDGLKVSYSIPGYEIEFVFNIDRFLSDLGYSGVMTKRAINRPERT
jgi:hypothetical protein